MTKKSLVSSTRDSETKVTIGISIGYIFYEISYLDTANINFWGST